MGPFWAAMKFKFQRGPSFGNNLHNGQEEALWTLPLNLGRRSRRGGPWVPINPRPLVAGEVIDFQKDSPRDEKRIVVLGWGNRPILRVMFPRNLRVRSFVQTWRPFSSCCVRSVKTSALRIKAGYVDDQRV